MRTQKIGPLLAVLLAACGGKQNAGEFGPDPTAERAVCTDVSAARGEEVSQGALLANYGGYRMDTEDDSELSTFDEMLTAIESVISDLGPHTEVRYVVDVGDDRVLVYDACTAEEPPTCQSAAAVATGREGEAARQAQYLVDMPEAQGSTLATRAALGEVNQDGAMELWMWSTLTGNSPGQRITVLSVPDLAVLWSFNAPAGCEPQLSAADVTCDDWPDLLVRCGDEPAEVFAWHPDKRVFVDL